MITRVPKHATTGLLDFLAPSVLCRANFSKNAWTIPPNKQQPVRDDPNLHRKIREQILAHSHSRHSSIPEPAKDKYNTYLAQLQRSVRSRDLVSTLKNWKLFDDHRRTLPEEAATHCHLPDNIIQDIGRLFMTQLRDSRMNQQLDEGRLALAEQYATSVSSTSCTALYACMLYHIEKKQPEAVIALYNTYNQTLDALSKKEETETEDVLSAVVVEEEQENISTDQDQMSVLIAAIAAHAMMDSFSGALKLYIAADARISGAHKIKHIRRLGSDPALQKRVEQYLHRLSTASLVARPGALSRHVTNLGQANAIKALEQIYNSILKGVSGHEPYLAARPEELSETRLYAMTDVGWTSFQTAFIKAERADLAAKVWIDLKELNIIPGVTMWTALLDTYADLRDSQQSMTTWNTMLQAGIKPDELSYRAIIAVLFDDQLPDEGLNRFKEYQKSFKAHTEKTLSVYNTVLRGLLRLNRFEEASELLIEMQKTGPKPDVVTYNTFMAYHARQSDFQSLSSIVNRMSEENISGDVVTFSTILTALLQVGKSDAPSTILSLMRKQGVQPNVATYTAIIDHQMRGHTMENLKAALMMLDKMEHDEGIRPNEVTYTSILAGLYRAQTSWLSRHQADALRKELVRRMKQLKLTFRLPTYHILIRSCLSSPDPEAHHDAIAYIEDMEREGIPRVQTTWYLLLAGLMQRKEWVLASVMVTKMLESGHEPSYRLQKLMNDIRKHRQYSQ